MPQYQVNFEKNVLHTDKLIAPPKPRRPMFHVPQPINPWTQNL